MTTSPRHLPVVSESPLPQLYARWIEQLLGGPIPSEKDATCGNCAMMSPAKPQGDGLFFNPQTKCCSYVPKLPNFLVGQSLADEEASTAHGRKTVEARLETAIGVTPLAMNKSALFEQLYGPNTFGQSMKLRCPHYLEEAGGLCGVWRHRNAICSTWFCKHVRGAVGLEFWTNLEQLLTFVEGELSRWCVLELGLDGSALRAAFPNERKVIKVPLNAHDVDEVVDEEKQRLLWGEWYGREKAFFLECARLVNGLDWPAVVSICGPALRAHTQFVVEAYRRLISPEIPEYLEVVELQYQPVGKETCRVTVYRSTDPLIMSHKVISVLGYFDGRPTEEALQNIIEEKRIRVERTLLQRLVDFKILVPRLPRGSTHAAESSKISE